MSTTPRHKQTPQFESPIFGTLYLHKVDNTFSWEGMFDLFKSGDIIELSVETDSQEQPSNSRLTQIHDFLDSYDKLKTDLYNHIYNAYNKTHFSVRREQIETMYGLSAILSKTNGDWGVVLEPNDDVDSVYNHFVRFTVRDGEIVWANID